MYKRQVLVEPRSRGVRVVESLGDPERARDVAAALIAERLGRRGFPRRLEDAARTAAEGADERDRGRRDLRDLTTFTVDPVTARDFDDAVSAQPAGDGIRLWIHIADVAAHVRPGDPLDAEALRRANSTYVPGTVEPMLPPALSDEACSLAPGVDRLAVTAEIVLSGSGESQSASFYRSRIRSDRRLSYEQLDGFFAGTETPPPEIAAELDLARRASAALADRRSGGSALEVSTEEPEFEFDRDGYVVASRSVAQTEAHRLIEQLMILTNERVAELCEKRGIPTLYRVHERPDPQRVEALAVKLAALDVPAPALPETISPAQAAELVAAASRTVGAEARRRGHGRAAYTSLVLRTLKQAYYSDRNVGHAGLGSPAYSHFTSPIRRYPDLIAHRALLSAIGAGEAEPERGEVREAAAWCSDRERASISIERDADRLCAAFLLGRELFESGWGRNFEGEVSGVIGAGAFVRFSGELADAYEGFLPARRIRGERFDLDETETALVGAKSGRRVRLGDPVEVRLDAVDLVPVGEPGR